MSICSPNYLHDAHIRFALRSGCDAICEKPLVLNPWNIEALKDFERDYDSDGAVYTLRDGTRHSDAFHGIEWEFRFGDRYKRAQGLLLIPSHAARYTDFRGAACIEAGVFPFSDGDAEHVWHITASGGTADDPMPIDAHTPICLVSAQTDHPQLALSWYTDGSPQSAIDAPEAVHAKLSTYAASLEGGPPADLQAVLADLRRKVS